jgi:hypothetical protein
MLKNRINGLSWLLINIFPMHDHSQLPVIMHLIFLSATPLPGAVRVPGGQICFTKDKFY